jgi:hypothetical protein
MEISETNDLYVLVRDSAPSWLAPDSSGVAIPFNPQPIILRAAFSPSLDEQSMWAARAWLMGEQHWLLGLAPCPDGPPHRLAFLFIRRNVPKVTMYQDGNYLRHGVTVTWYQRATLVTSLGPGLFLTSTIDGGSVWRAFRQELDPFNRWILTLSPVRPSSQCPEPDFSMIKSPLVAAEVTAQYADMVRAVTANSYRDVVTKAKNIVEAIVAERLGKTEKSRDLFENLKAVKTSLDERQQRDSCGWTDLEYHLANKIRLVHGQTHATGPAKMGRPLRPEFALSTVEDLIELLYSWGYCKPQA